jgi:60S ribosomal subunit assembly/export protein LOC1
LLNDKKKTLGKRKPPHLRYSEAELKVPQLNGIRPAGVAKPPNAKKGKNFVDDKESMNAIMALVMAEKEGNIESKMMRARQMEEVREARRLEMEKRAEGKREGLEERKQNIKNDSKKRRRSESEVAAPKERSENEERSSKSKRKRVSFG